MQVRKQQFELDMEKQTSSKSGKEYVKSVYCHPAYLTYMQLHHEKWWAGWSTSWALENRCFWMVVLEKTLESPLDCKEIKPVNPKGNQSWIFIGRTDVEAETPVLWPPEAKSWLIWKDPDAEGWRLKMGGEGNTEDEIFGWHHLLNGHESE